MSLYEVLEVSARATPETIRAAFKSLMQRHHPDKCGASRAAGERARELLQAYDVLSDSLRRADYDAALAQGGATACADSPGVRVMRALATYAAHGRAAGSSLSLHA